jgi:predicted Zn-dependent protease
LSCSSVEKIDDSQTQKEIETGKALAARIIKKYGIIKDEKLTQYIHSIGASIAKVSPRPELPYIFGVLDTNEVNAFACPGGIILITKGSLVLMKNEAELAYILSHEISHVGIDHSKIISNSSNPIVEIIDIIGSLIGPDMGSFVSATSDAISQELEKELFESGRSKEAEFRADENGLFLGQSLGYDPEAFPKYLEVMASSLEKDNAVWSKTHPSVKDRISKLKKEIVDSKFPKGKLNPEKFLQYISKYQKSK